MLDLVHALADASLDNDALVKNVMDSAKMLTGAERCSIFIVDAEKQELVAHFEDKIMCRMPMDRGIAGHVVQTGKTMKINNAYDHPQFNPEVDRQTGYTTKSMLCMPVKYGSQTVAVAQVCARGR